MDKLWLKSDWKIKFVFFLFIAILIYSLWQNSLNGPFILDDLGDIVETSAIHISSLSFNSFKDVIINADAKNRPLANLTFALNWYFGQNNTFGYHIVNLIIHWFSSIFLFLFLQELFSIEKAIVGLEERYIKYLPYIITLLWLSSPLQVQSVTYIVQRMTSMAGMFFFLSLLFYAQGRRKKNKWLYGLSAISWILSLLCKETSAILPFVLILYEWIFSSGNKNINNKKILKFAILSISTLIFSVAVYSYISGSNLFVQIVSSDFSHRGYTMTQRVITQWRVVIFYIGLLLLPLPSRLNIDHYINVSTGFFTPLTTILSLVTILGLLYLAYRIRTKYPLLSFGIFWYFLTLVIESSILNLELIFEHRLYVPSLGFWLVLVYLLYKLAYFVSPSKKYLILMLVFVLIFVGQSYGTILRNQVWQSKFNLWKDASEKSPNKSRTHNNLGLAYKDKGMMNKAVNEFILAIKLDYNNAEAHNNLGLAYQWQGMLDKAIKEYKTAIKIGPGFIKAYKNLSKALMNKEKGEEAYNSLGNALLMDGDLVLAEKAYREALDINSQYVAALYNLGFCLSDQGRYQEAVVYHNKALVLNKNEANPYFGLGIAYEKLGKPTLALQNWKKFIKLTREDNPWRKKAFERIKALQKS